MFGAPEQETLRKYDCVVIATDHSCYDYEFISRNSSLIVDTRNAINGKGKERKRCKSVAGC